MNNRIYTAIIIKFYKYCYHNNKIIKKQYKYQNHVQLNIISTQWLTTEYIKINYYIKNIPSLFLSCVTSVYKKMLITRTPSNISKYIITFLYPYTTLKKNNLYNNGQTLNQLMRNITNYNRNWLEIKTYLFSKNTHLFTINKSPMAQKKKHGKEQYYIKYFKHRIHLTHYKPVEEEFYLNRGVTNVANKIPLITLPWYITYRIDFKNYSFCSPKLITY